MERTRRDVVLGSLAAGLVGCAGGAERPRATGQKPRNVVVILTDDQRWNSFSFLGHPFLRTPNLDRVAAQGAWFPQTFVTTSLCCPSRASMLTGLYAHAHGVLSNTDDLDPAFPTYATILQAAGVDTAYVGKWHMGGADPHPRPGWKRWVGFRGQGRYVYPGDGPPLDRSFSFDGELREQSGYVTTLLTKYALDYLDERQPGRPFCLVLGHKAVHAPFVPRVEDKDRFADAPIPEVLPDTDEAYAQLPAWLRDMRHETEFGADHPYKTWADFRTWYLDYHRTLLAVDDSVGQILGKLSDKGLLDETVVLFTSDNGFMFGEKGVLDKRNFYEPSIRVPLLALGPGLVPAGSVRQEVALNVDLAPTVLDLLGVEPPERWHGCSLAPVLRGEAPPDWRQEFVYEYFFERQFPHTPTLFGIRTPKAKLGAYYGLEIPDELYDLEADPGETVNRIDDPAYADRRKGLMGRMKKHFGELGMLTDPVWGRNWVAAPEDAAARAGAVDGGEEKSGGEP